MHFLGTSVSLFPTYTISHGDSKGGKEAGKVGSACPRASGVHNAVQQEAVYHRSIHGLLFLMNDSCPFSGLTGEGPPSSGQGSWVRGIETWRSREKWLPCSWAQSETQIAFQSPTFKPPVCLLVSVSPLRRIVFIPNEYFKY